MLKLTDIFKLILFVSALLTAKVSSAQSVNTHVSTQTRVINPSSHLVHHDEPFIFEDNDISETVKIDNSPSIADSPKSDGFYFGLVKNDFAKIVLQKITTPLPRFTHLFIFFHCWKLFFS